MKKAILHFTGLSIICALLLAFSMDDAKDITMSFKSLEDMRLLA